MPPNEEELEVLRETIRVAMETSELSGVAVATESLLVMPDRSWSDAPIVSDEGRPEET